MKFLKVQSKNLKKNRFNKHQKWNVYIANNTFFKIHC
jgi:hypothetical protein